ncbi:hypothetical protein RMSM_06009 [Rhodopirellula maiorica SM1]|uniref:Uncharacterized protein n=1 Tax=Rhodopirellula maiorica SM1 TaxID=1265738 RepID=M5RSW4_9BACT|nr:hypothetical protein RMSM_06009 [Rhodopirellula maiorica SM1]
MVSCGVEQFSCDRMSAVEGKPVNLNSPAFKHFVQAFRISER